jgi:hypothetical protein
LAGLLDGLAGKRHRFFSLVCVFFVYFLPYTFQRGIRVT